LTSAVALLKLTLLSAHQKVDPSRGALEPVESVYELVVNEAAVTRVTMEAPQAAGLEPGDGVIAGGM
jgi:hypothetical protein